LIKWNGWLSYFYFLHVERTTYRNTDLLR
jgi:hypothetical protein